MIFVVKAILKFLPQLIIYHFKDPTLIYMPIKLDVITATKKLIALMTVLKVTHILTCSDLPSTNTLSSLKLQTNPFFKVFIAKVCHSIFLASIYYLVVLAQQTT